MNTPDLEFRLLRHDAPEDVTRLFGLFEQAREYSLLVEGRLPTLEEAKQELLDCPPGKTLEDKFFGAYWLDDRLVGCADLIRGYPEPHIAYLGLLLFAQSCQGQGLGVRALAQLVEMARSWGCSLMRLAVIETNLRALAFWQREGFCEIYRKPTQKFLGDAIVMEKMI